VQNLDFLFNLLYCINKAKVFLNFFPKNIVKNKVKEVIKEENEEKDSLFNKIKIKSQAAMEYLMTYGWAILIIALALGVLYSLGIMNPKNFLPRAPPGSCFVFRPNGPGTTDYVSLQGTCGYLPMYVASFNGINSYLSIPNSPNLNPATQITVSVFVKVADVGANNIVLIDKTASYGLILDGSKWWNGPYLTVNYTRVVYGIGSYSNRWNKWNQIVATFDGISRVATLYINGQLINRRNVTESSANLISTTSPITIGIRANGSIANVQIYNTALTPQEIQYLYQQGLGGAPVRLQNLVAWWPLNGDAKDYSGNNLHGTIYNVTFVQNYNPP